MQNCHWKVIDQIGVGAYMDHIYMKLKSNHSWIFESLQCVLYLSIDNALGCVIVSR